MDETAIAFIAVGIDAILAMSSDGLYAGLLGDLVAYSIVTEVMRIYGWEDIREDLVNIAYNTNSLVGMQGG